MMTAAAAATGDTLVEPHPSGLTRSGAARLDAIDMLRGLVIVIMVLDHVRDFFHADAFLFDATDPVRSNALLYATRWVTHLCAPTFVFLAGVSIWFQRENGKTGGALSAFLLKRGAWLILLEVTVVTFGINFGEPFVFLQVIWAIGASMICMAVIARLPARAVLALGMAIVALYQLVIGLTEGATGVAGVIRNLMLVPNFFQGSVPVLAFYPMIPWLGVMCLGFGLAPVFRFAPVRRRRAIAALTIGALALFLLVRFLNGYGDQNPWAVQPTGGQTLLSFLNISKYPPSPAYVLATLGVSMLIFLALEHLRGPLARILLTFGRTPLFSYLCHFYIAHLLMLATVLATGFPAKVAFDVLAGANVVEAKWGFSLGVVYLAWLSVLVLLYPLSRWFEGVKRRRRDWWLSYL